MRGELDRWFGDRVLYAIANEPADFTIHRKVDRAFLAERVSAFDQQHFYLCGPPGKGPDVKGALLDLAADPEKIVHEKWS